MNDGIAIDVLEQEHDISITQSGDDLLLDIIIEDHNYIDVVMEGTCLFNPSEDIDPLIKDYLGNPNDLTVIYVGGSVITPSSYTHTQSAGVTVWYINHGLNRPGVVIQCFNTSHQEVLAEIQHIDNNNSVARFGFAMTGTAECR
jgi:hypothetical protein